jgi:hypothetical protein
MMIKGPGTPPPHTAEARDSETSHSRIYELFAMKFFMILLKMKYHCLKYFLPI